MGNTSKRPSQAKPPKQCQNTTINKFIPQLPSKAKQSKTNSQNEFNAQPPVLAQAPLVKKQLLPLKDDHIFEEYLELDFLPMEVFSYLISFFDLHMIVNVIPRVCKALFNDISEWWLLENESATRKTSWTTKTRIPNVETVLFYWYDSIMHFKKASYLNKYFHLN
jgi:hypothetical protein